MWPSIESMVMFATCYVELVAQGALFDSAFSMRASKSRERLSRVSINIHGNLGSSYFSSGTMRNEGI